MKPERRIGALRSAALLLALAACADPGSVRIDVDVDEPDLAELFVAVNRLRGGEGGPSEPEQHVAVLRCTFPAGGRADDGCALQDGDGRWEGDQSPLSFLLYGRPRTELEVTIEGHRTAGGRAVTSTTTRVTLPGEGETAVVPMQLFARTRVAGRCPALEVAPDLGDGANDRSALAIAGRAANGTSHLITSSGGRLSIVRYSVGSGGCTLSVKDRIDLPAGGNTCRVRDASIVVGPADRAAGESGPGLVAAICQTNPTDGTVRVLSVVYGLRGDDGGELAPRFAFATLTGTNLTSGQVSRPTLADLDGDGRPEILVLLNRGRALSFGRWDVLTGAPGIEELPLTGVTPFGIQVYNGPLVLSSAQLGVREVALIAGYPGGLGVVAGAPPVYTELHVDARTPIMSPAASITESPGRVAVQVATLYEETGLEVVALEGTAAGMTKRDAYTIAPPADATLAEDPEVRLAIGDVLGEGRPAAVAVHNGAALVFPLERGATPVTFRVWTGSPVQDVQTVLLADVDGQPGAEVISYDPDSPLVHAVDGDGVALGGWPIQVLQGGTLRLALADLDAPRSTRANADLDLVALSLRSVEVVKLGPSSYDAAAMPWPSPQRDGRASAAHGPTEDDPRAAR